MDDEYITGNDFWRGGMDFNRQEYKKVASGTGKDGEEITKVYRKRKRMDK